MKTLATLAAMGSILTSVISIGCDTSDPTSAIVDNGFADTAPQTYVYKVWWSVTLFPDPIAAQTSSDANRVVPGSDFAYALLAPDWSPSQGTPPPKLIAVKTKHAISAARGETVRIAIDDTTVDGDCAAGSHLSEMDAALITTVIFPGDFAGQIYDPSTCAVTPIPAEVDAGQGD